MQLKTTHTPHIHLNSLTFFGLEICCIYSMAGPRICSFFAIKTFIGGSPLFWIFKPIESSSAQNNPLAAVYPVCVCVCECLLTASLLLSGSDLESTLNPMEKEKPVLLTSAQAQKDECLARTHSSVPDSKYVNRCRLGLCC